MTSPATDMTSPATDMTAYTQTRTSTITWPNPNSASSVWIYAYSATYTGSTPGTFSLTTFPPNPFSTDGDVAATPAVSKLVFGFTITAQNPTSSSASSSTQSTSTALSTSTPQPSPVVVSIPSTSISLAFTRSAAQHSSISSTSASSSPASSASAASATKSPVAHRSAITSGDAAGIGIACAFGGAILSALLLYLCFGKKRHRPYVARTPSRGPSMRHRQYSGSGKSPETVLMPLARSGSELLFHSKLPPPLPERELASSMSSFGTMIKNHANSYFSGSEAENGFHPQDASLQLLAQLLGNTSPYGPKTVNSLLANARSRAAAVRFILAWAILPNIEPTSPPENTLLPPELAQCLQAMRAPHVGLSGTYHAPTRSAADTDLRASRQ